MENKKNVDKLQEQIKNSLPFQQKMIFYTHRAKKCVDNVEKITHMKKYWKIKACHNFKNRCSQCLHKVIHKLSTKCG